LWFLSNLLFYECFYVLKFVEDGILEVLAF